MVRQLKNIVGAISNASPESKRAIYDELGVNLTYFADGRIHVGAGTPQVSGSKPPTDPGGPRVLEVSAGGAVLTPSTRDPWQAWLSAA